MLEKLKWIAVILLVVGAVTAGVWIKGVLVERDALAQSVTSLTHEVTQVHAARKIDASAEAAGVARAAQTLRKNETITREVIRYVELHPDASADCRLPAEWVRIHNAAVGPVDDAAGDRDAPR